MHYKSLMFSIGLSLLAATGVAHAQKAKTPEPAKPTATVAPAGDQLKAGLAALDERKFTDAITAFNAAFNAGQADGAFYLGRMAELGVGLQADPEKARVLYLAAADKGSAKAMNRVGLMHYRGEGVLQDYKAAAEMICKAADLGDSDAQYNCAGLYAEGKGVAKDFGKALPYYKKAADAGHIGALNSLAFLYAKGADGIAPNLTQAQGYFEKVASRGNPVGLFELAQMYEVGQPMAKDLIKAHMYYNLAAARQLPAASVGLERVSNQLSTTDIEKAQADAKAWKPVAQ